MTAHYEPPKVNGELTKEEIRRRYEDTALIIFKEQENRREVMSYLTFGSSRRTMEYSHCGNDPVIIRRPAELTSRGQPENLPSLILSMYRKPRENCAIT